MSRVKTGVRAKSENLTAPNATHPPRSRFPQKKLFQYHEDKDKKTVYKRVKEIRKNEMKGTNII